MYRLASVFEMVSSPAFNVSIYIWSLPVAVLFFISRSAASTSHDVTVDYGTLFTVVYLGVEFLYLFYDLILIMDFSSLLVQECDHSLLA